MSALVVACLRHVDLRPDVDPLTGRVERDHRGAGPSAAEWAALELALRVAQAWDGEVLAVCAGPVDAEGTLRQAAAVGARVLRVPAPGVPGGAGLPGVPAGAGVPGVPAGAGVPDEPLGPLDRYLDELAGSGERTARALALAIRAVGDPALVICGDRSADRGCGALPAFLAAELGAAQALGLVRVEVGRRELVGERRLDRGRRERLRIPCPAVISVEACGLRLRRASVPDVLAAEASPVPVFVADVAGPGLTRGPVRPLRPRTHVVAPPGGESARERVLALTGALEERTPPTLLHPSGPGEAADLLLDYLRRNGYLAPAGGDAAGTGSG